MKRLLRLAPIALLLPTLASADVVWKGNLETGNLSQFDRTQSVSSSRLMVVNSPVREGKYALKVTVRQGDNPINASGNRNEVLYLGREASGSEYYYKWSTLFPTSFPKSDKWALFTQWHHDGNGGSPPLEFYVLKDVLCLRVGGANGKIVWTAPIARENWHDFVLRVKWSSDAKVGFIELYHNGKLALPRYYAATQYKGQRNYLKLGLYRDSSISKEGVVFHDGFVQATSREDVIPTVVAEAPSVETPEEAPAPEAPAVEEGPPDEDESSLEGITPVVQRPSNSAPDTSALVPGDPTLANAAGCGASATGGGPLLVAAALALLALLGRRKKAPAYARARRQPRRR